jgi:hypothetical protein
MKRNFFSRRCEESAILAYFASMRNVEIWSETKMEWSKNKTKKKQKIAIIFVSKQNKAKGKQKTPITFALKRNEAKQKRKNAIIFTSKRNGSKIFLLRCEKSVFSLFSHLKRNENEIKRKQSEKMFILFRIEAKWKDRKRNEKIMEVKQSKNTLY